MYHDKAHTCPFTIFVTWSALLPEHWRSDEHIKHIFYCSFVFQEGVFGCHIFESLTNKLWLICILALLFCKRKWSRDVNRRLPWLNTTALVCPWKQNKIPYLYCVVCTRKKTDILSHTHNCSARVQFSPISLRIEKIETHWTLNPLKLHRLQKSKFSRTASNLSLVPCVTSRTTYDENEAKYSWIRRRCASCGKLHLTVLRSSAANGRKLLNERHEAAGLRRTVLRSTVPCARQTQVRLQPLQPLRHVWSAIVKFSTAGGSDGWWAVDPLGSPAVYSGTYLPRPWPALGLQRLRWQSWRSLSLSLSLSLSISLRTCTTNW